MTTRAVRDISQESPQGGEVSPELLASICHDLKQHIAIGLLLSEGLREGAPPVEVHHRLEVLHLQFEHAASLVSVLSGGPAAGAALSDLAVLSERSVDAARSSHQISFEVDGSDHVVVGNPVLLRRAVANLLDNACHAATTAGHVTVQVGTSDGERWVEVSDDGPGFGNVRSRTGRGLPIVREAVRAGAGQLRIAGALGGGTAIRMTFPAVG